MIPVDATPPAPYVNVVTTTWTSLTDDPFGETRDGGGGVDDYDDQTTTALAAVVENSIRKTGPITATAGSIITYVVSVFNSGPFTSTGAVVSDVMPFQADAITATFNVPGGASGVCPITPATSGDAFVCTLGDIPPGVTVLITSTAKIDAATPLGADLTNKASLTLTSFDSDYTDNTTTFETEIDTRADLEVNKTGPATATAGEQITYTIVFTNNGPSYASNVDVKDLLPPGVTFDSGTSSQGLCVNAICQLNEVAPGTPITMVITGTVGSDVTGPITNTAQAFSATTDDNKANNSDTAPTTVNARTALQIAKRDLTDPVYAGGSYFYEIVITNTGPSDAANTVVTDTLPTVLTVLGVSPECTFSNAGSPSTVSCAVGSFPAGTSRDFLVNVQVASDVVSNTVGVNTAGITTTTPIDTANSTLLTTQNTTYLQTSGLPTDLRLTKSASPASVIAGGGQVTFTLNVTNAGPSPASAVQVVDAFPAAFTLVRATTSKDTSVSLCSTGGTCDLGEMAVGASAIITLVYTVPAGVSAGTYTNTAHVSSPSSDSNSANNTATAPVAVTESADLSIRKVANPNPAIPGQDLTYTIIVTNAGPSDADSVTVADTLPAGFTLALVTASQGGCAALPCNLGTIPAGGNATLTIVGKVNASATAGQLANTATVSSAQTDPVPGNNSGTVSPAIATGADLELVKTGTATANPGDTVVYTVTVRNLGPSDAAGVRVTDTLPAGLTLTGVSGCTRSSAVAIRLCVIWPPWPPTPVCNSRYPPRSTPRWPQAQAWKIRPRSAARPRTATPSTTATPRTPASSARRI